MTTRRSLFTLAALPALALACATSTNYRVDANVRTLHAGSHDASGITAVAGADVALQCPDASASRSLGKTDAEGTLSVEGSGGIPLACTLAISEPGYKSSELKVGSVCTETSMGACRTLAVRAILAPEGASNSATR